MAKDIGRNDPCPCGSGVKYKKCCLNKPKSVVDERPQPQSTSTDPTEGAHVYSAGSEAYQRWESFWEKFAEATLDEQFALARGVIQNEPNFDGEWVFTLLVENLADPARLENRYQDWFEVLDLVRKKHPLVSTEESGVIGATALLLAFGSGVSDHVSTALDLLFETPAASIDHIFRELDRLAYHGFTGVLQYLCAGWDAILAGRGLMRGISATWAEWAAMAQIAAWAKDDIERARTLDDLHDALGDLSRQIDAARIRPHLTRFLGPDIGPLNPDELNPEDTVLQFSRSLVQDHNWPAFKAYFAAQELLEFFQGRAPIPNSDLAIEYAHATLDSGLFGMPYPASAFIEAIAHLTPWLQERGLLKDAHTGEAIQQELQELLPELSETIIDYAGGDPLVQRNLEELMGPG